MNLRDFNRFYVIGLCLILGFCRASFGHDAISDRCAHALLSYRMYEPSLADAVKAMNPFERRTRHLAELVPSLLQVQSLVRMHPGPWQEQLIQYANSLIQNHEVTYANFWHFTFLSLTLRGMLKTTVSRDDVLRQFLPPSQTGALDLLMTRYRDGFDVYEETVQRWADGIISGQSVVVPLIDTAADVHWQYPKGAFALKRDVLVSPAGVSRSEHNDYDRVQDQYALWALAHDFSHAISIDALLTHLRSHYGISVDEIQTLHQQISSRIMRSTNWYSLLLAYEHLLHENYRYEVNPAFSKIFPILLRPRASLPQFRWSWNFAEDPSYQKFVQKYAIYQHPLDTVKERIQSALAKQNLKIVTPEVSQELLQIFLSAVNPSVDNTDGPLENINQLLQTHFAVVMDLTTNQVTPFANHEQLQSWIENQLKATYPFVHQSRGFYEGSL